MIKPKIDKETLQKLINESSSYSEILKKLGMKSHTGCRKTIISYVKQYGIDDSSLRERIKKQHINFIKCHTNKIKKEYSSILVENSTYCSSTLKRRIIKDGLIENKCCLCGQLPHHNGMVLTLQLDHINGIHNDHQIENLRILCPNCHTQTHTWGSKGRKKKFHCLKCRAETKGYSEYCVKCRDIPQQQKKFIIEKEKLEYMVNNMSMRECGRLLGVTDNTVRDRCKSLSIKIPKFKCGHWLDKSEVYNVPKEILQSEIAENGLTNISKKYKCGYHELKNHCKKLNIETKSYNLKEITKEEIDEIMRLKNEGNSNRKIAILLEIKRGRVDKVINGGVM